VSLRVLVPYLEIGSPLVVPYPEYLFPNRISPVDLLEFIRSLRGKNYSRKKSPGAKILNLPS